MGKDKKISIVLGLLLLFTLIGCLIILSIELNPTYTDVILVKDATSTDKRIISDKLEVKDNIGGSLDIAAETPDGLLNPDDIFIDTPSNAILEDSPSKTDRRTTINTGDLPAKPLDFFNLGEVIEVLETTVETESDKKQDTSLKRLLNKAKEIRNSDKPPMATYFFRSVNNTEVRLREKNTDGLVLVYFTLNNAASLENIKQILPLYEAYKDSIPFLFVNNSFEGSDYYDKVKTTFTELGIPIDLPVYYDYYSEFFMFSEISSINFGYALINTDFYVFNYKQTNEIPKNIDEELTKMRLEQEQFKLEDIKITQEYEKSLDIIEVPNEIKDS